MASATVINTPNPHYNNSPDPQQQSMRTTHKKHLQYKYTKKMSLPFFIMLQCIFIIFLTISSFVVPVHCAKVLPITVERASRYARSAIYANGAADMTTSSSSSSSLQQNVQTKSPENYLAALGLRTRIRPQKFYSKNERKLEASTGGVTLNVEDSSRASHSRPSPNDLTSLNLVMGAREDICREHCHCAKVKNAFTTISCDFQTNPKLRSVFGSDFKVPEDTTSINIKLAKYTKFRLERGFFANNKVNSLSIEGAYSTGEQVEIQTEAFWGNHGPYPEITITNVFSVVIRAKAFSGNCKFTVRNSNDLILYADAFQNASINSLISGINDLRIEEKAFNSAQAKLRIENSMIDNIYRFEASLREISFVNCTIGNINGGTFDVLNINIIVFEECRIDVIKAKAITEKLYSNHVSITGATIGIIESEAIYGSGIAELILTKNKIDTIHPNAIHVTAVNATITGNNIKHLGNNWMRVKDWSNIQVSNNQFGVYGRMLLEEAKQPARCRFESNSLTQPLPGSLNLTHCVIREISVNMPCKCKHDWLDQLTDHDLRSELYCTIDDKLSHCFNASTFNTLKYFHEVCDEEKTTLDCVKNMNLKKIDGVFFTPEELERRDQRIPKLMVILGGSLTLIALIVIAVIMALRCSGRQKSGGGGATSGASRRSPHDHLHNISAEERHVIAQTLHLMQKKHPEIHRQVNDHVQLLLQRDLSEKKCVKVISNIVNLLNKVAQPGDDFVAFNRVLTQHLQPQLPSAPPAMDPIYAEPGMTGDVSLENDGLYTMSTSMVPVLPQANSSGIGGASAGIGGIMSSSSAPPPEHIYSEPHGAQQPLLPNEYASPADGRHYVEPTDEYTLPVNERVITPANNRPQYATPVRQKQQLPTPQNLPDVLYQSHNQNQNSPNSQKPLTNVQRIAQDLQNMPKFHIINAMTPNTQRRNLHLLMPPVYAAPDTTSRRIPSLGQQRMTEARLATPEYDECDYDMRGATALPDSGSNHSGGSNETVKMDDVILYADA